VYEWREVAVRMKLSEDLPEIKEDEGQTNPLILIIGENKKLALINLDLRGRYYY